MKQLLDFLPLLVFFVAYKFYGIFAATAAIIAASAIQLGLMYTLYRKVEKMHLITFALLFVFGGATVFFQDDTFIKWKVTIVYGLFTLALLISNLMDKPVMKAMLGKEMKLPDLIWKKVGYGWAAFFASCASANLYIAFNLPQETWVNFKVFGLTGLTIGFTVLTFIYLFKYLPKEEK
ncbi:septation protein A [uncultured Ferrimonas sp.]|uniref:septation protein A n=1 Tax=uncultured Ferrimonas sp. TaxID=432640 RepID=UPI002618CBC4|nr:septation protein A [uncultured Ferrimonas sp.]